MWKLWKFTLRFFCRKIRESNARIAKVIEELISRNIFSVTLNTKICLCNAAVLLCLFMTKCNEDVFDIFIISAQELGKRKVKNYMNLVNVSILMIFVVILSPRS